MVEYRRILDGALRKMMSLSISVHETRDWSYVHFTGKEIAGFFAKEYREVLYVIHDGWTDTIYIWRGNGNTPRDIEEHLKRIGYVVV
jgi:hypothetical protein